MSGRRLLLYDDTCRGRGVGLTHSWIAGAALYRALQRLDDAVGCTRWDDGLDALLARTGDAPIAELQFWGHGKWGAALVDGRPLDGDALVAGHPLHARLATLRRRLVPGALVWFRTCETFGGEQGQRFARALADFLDCRVAGHTFIIGPLQSGLHSLAPGETPRWSSSEGLLEGTPDAPRRARWSTPRAPNTITCLHGAIPEGY